MSRARPKKSSSDAPPNWRTTVGQRLREQRQQMGLTQLELAERIGATTRTLIAYEAGTTTIRFEKLMSLAAAGVDINDLVYGRGTAPSQEIDEALWQRVKAWANETCVDSLGRPIHELERYQIMQRVYRNLASSGSAAGSEDIPKKRSAGAGRPG